MCCAGYLNAFLLKRPWPSFRLWVGPLVERLFFRGHLVFCRQQQQDLYIFCININNIFKRKQKALWLVLDHINFFPLSLQATAYASTVDVQHGPGRPDRLEQVQTGFFFVNPRITFSSPIFSRDFEILMQMFLQVMSLHPQYLKIYNKSQSFIMRGDGPLPFHYRHYIAIMVSNSRLVIRYRVYTPFFRHHNR